MIPDHFFYPLAAVVVAALIGLALVWPQGQGAPERGAMRVHIGQTTAAK